ncbi:BMQ_0737 family morphogenetic spore coat protein [Alkalihalobacterium elongatum]|uniref:hypothetical protein n=1 Tax=Alkalihalobacterium elongatum TaxID=2675466 RepID=UPI001C1FDE64|nr:hypothetical protein [Alkalihalobacterium elongatum]
MNKSSPISEALCIRVPKVYDWVTRQVDFSRMYNGTKGLRELNFKCNGFSEVFTDPCHFFNDICNDTVGIVCNNLTIDCIITDSFGNPINPEEPGAILCQELTEPRNRTDINFELPNGNTITLQKVKVLKKGFYVIQISNGNRVVCISDPQPFSITESFFLCAPQGSKVQCEITNLQCEAIQCCNSDGSFNQIDVHISMCQNIQMEAFVKLAITADFCQPRQEIPFECPSPLVPPQCPNIFPISDVRDIQGKVCKPVFVSFGPNQTVTQINSVSPTGIAKVTLETRNREDGVRVHCKNPGNATAVLTVRNNQTNQIRNVTLRIICT